MIGGAGLQSLARSQAIWRRIRDIVCAAGAAYELIDNIYYLLLAIRSRQESLFAVSYAITPIGQAGLYITVIAGWWLVFRRHLPFYVLCLIVIIGINAEILMLIDGLMFHALGAIGIAPSNNPQWLKMALIAWAALILLTLISFRATRTIDRLFMTVITGAIFTLVTLFHLIIVEGGLRDVKQASAQTMSAVIRLPEPTYTMLCSRMDLTCFGWEDNAPLPGFSPAERAMIEPLVAAVRNQPEFWHSWLYRPPFALTNQIQAGYYRLGTTNRIIIDDGPLSRATWQLHAWFYMLAICAIYGWLFGGLTLMMLHKRAIGNRRPA